jgi:hypothetical protein
MGANAQTSVPLFVANTVLTAAQQNISAATGVPVFATTVTRDAAFGGSNKVLAEGQLCYIEASNIVQYYDGAAWATVGPSTSQFATFNETQANNTDGGASVATTFTTRVLNTTVVNDITGCSLATNQVTLPTGSYVVTVLSPFRNTNLTKIRLFNVTDSTNTAIGQNTNMDSGGAVGGVATLQAQFTIAASKAFAVQYYCQSAVATFGLGRAINAGTSEVYTTIQIQKIA